MTGTPADDRSAPGHDDEGPGIDADAFSPVIDPDYVPGDAPKDAAPRGDGAGSEPQPDRARPEETGG